MKKPDLKRKYTFQGRDFHLSDLSIKKKQILKLTRSNFLSYSTWKAAKSNTVLCEFWQFFCSLFSFHNFLVSKDRTCKSASLSITYGCEFFIFKWNDYFQWMKIISFSKNFDYTLGRTEIYKKDAIIVSSQCYGL